MLNTYYRDRLSADQQIAYDHLCRGIRKQSRQIEAPYTDDFGRVIRAINWDHPEFFYVNWLDRVSYTVMGETAHLRLNYMYHEDEVMHLTGRMREIARGLAGISSYSKALCIHDWFVRHVEYDHRGLEQVIRSPGMFSAAGPLMRQKAVCEGISKLACLLMREKGIEAGIVIGSAQSGVPHAWNMLEVGDQRVYADITFDIGLSSNGVIQRKYFLLSRAEMARDHVTQLF